MVAHYHLPVEVPVDVDNWGMVGGVDGEVDETLG